MGEITVRDLNDQGDEVLDRVAAGEHLTVTRDRRPIAELRPLPRPRLRAEELLNRWSRLPVSTRGRYARTSIVSSSRRCDDE